jgi:hypothetical protein
LAQKAVSNIKIPNLKHQITNKFQISIFNDQNIHLICIASLRKSRPAGQDATGAIKKDHLFEISNLDHLGFALRFGSGW